MGFDQNLSEEIRGLVGNRPGRVFFVEGAGDELPEGFGEGEGVFEEAHCLGVGAQAVHEEADVGGGSAAELGGVVGNQRQTV